MEGSGLASHESTSYPFFCAMRGELAWGEDGVNGEAVGGEHDLPHEGGRLAASATPHILDCLIWRQSPGNHSPNCAALEKIDKKFRCHVCILSPRAVSAVRGR